MRITELLAEAKNPKMQAAIAINMKKRHQKPKSEGVAEAVWDRPSQSYVPRDGRTFGQTNHPREEHCDACGAATGHAGPGEDSNVDDEGNVYCDDCYADQKGVAEGYEPPTSAKGSPAYRASLLRKKQERQAAADAKKKQQGVAEGKEELHTQLQSINQKLKLMRGGPVGEPNSMAFVEKRKELLKQKEQILSQLKQGVAEGHADQQRKVFKKNGEPVGEVGIDRESSPGNGQWYMKYYATGDDFSGYDSMEEAVADLKHLVNQFKAEGVAEAAPSTELQDKMRQVRPKGKGITRTELQNAMRRKGKKQWHCPECATYDDNVHGKFCSKYKPKEQGVAEGLPQTLRKVVPGYAKREIDKKMDAGKFGKTDADKDANFQRYKKIQDKLKEQGVAEGSDVYCDACDRVITKKPHVCPGLQGVAEGETWSKHNNPRAGGMSKKSVKSYRRSHPGSKIQTAVTTKPSKIKKGSKDAKRRKSFCARMRGMKKHNTSAKTARDPNSNINKSLRRWHCESVEQMLELVMLAEQYIQNRKKSK